jgi:transposase InsO family protein
MVIRQWATGGGGGTEQLRRVHPGTGDRRQPVDERGGERILGHAGDDLVEQPAPFLQRRGQVASHLAVEVPLPGPGGLVQLHGAGGTPVIRADLHRGPPHLHLPEDEILCFLDDHSHYAISITCHQPVTGPAVVTTFRQAIADQGIPASVLSDNGMVFTTRFAGGRAGRDTLNGFSTLLRDLGVAQKHSKPNHPTTCGKVERFHQTLKKWLRAQPQQPTTIAELQALCDHFINYYNTRRPHRSLNRRTPRLPTKPDPKPPRPAQHHPNRSPGSAATWSTATANSPSATTADYTTSESDEPPNPHPDADQRPPHPHHPGAHPRAHP